MLAPGDIYEAGTWAMSDAFMADRDHWPRRRGPEHPPLERDDVLLRGVVKDAKVGETYMGMEPMTKFLSVTVSTRFGDVELCHPFELVAEEQKDNVKPGGHRLHPLHPSPGTRPSGNTPGARCTARRRPWSCCGISSGAAGPSGSGAPCGATGR